MSELHPDVAEYRQTCPVCPEQYSGTLRDGRHFYYRYRFGWASLAVGPTGDDVLGQEDTGTHIGDPMQGCFETEDERNQVFAQLLAQVRT